MMQHSRVAEDSTPGENCMIKLLLTLSFFLTLNNILPAAEKPKVRATSKLHFTLTSDQLARLNKALEPHHANYDPRVKMLREPFHSPGYHTTLTGGFVHSTRSALTYAVALLDTGDEKLLHRAEDILQKVTSLQDQDPSSRTYGIWSWFLEEPLDMMEPPDWNWADFCGVQLLQVALDHRNRLSPETATLVDTAIRHAALSIHRRNVGPSYTNIAIMGTYVTLVAAELYGWSDMLDYALARLRNFHDYTMENESFTEYNSPTYSMVAMYELGRMKLHVRNTEAHQLVEKLYRLAWDEIAVHFHAPTRQWAGPHSRCYSTLLTPNTLSVLQRSIGGNANLGTDEPNITEQRLPLPCPKGLEHFFTTLTEPRDVIKTYLKDNPPITGTTHLEPSFTLGTINRGDFWNQRRSLLAYWGTAEKPSYLNLRFLRDGYDFADAQFFSAQRGGDVLAVVNFGLDGGNTHIGLDRIKNGIFLAEELCLRFEFGGAACKEKFNVPRKLTGTTKLQFDGLKMSLSVPYAVFGDEKLRWKAGAKDDAAWLDLVIYDGPEREFHLSEITSAAIGIALSIGKEDTQAVSVAIKNQRLDLNWNGLHVNTQLKPDKVGLLHHGVKF